MTLARASTRRRTTRSGSRRSRGSRARLSNLLTEHGFKDIAHARHLSNRVEPEVVEGKPTVTMPHLEVGERYILYTTGTDAAPVVQACSRYAAGDSLVTERTALGRPMQTYPAPRR